MATKKQELKMLKQMKLSELKKRQQALTASSKAVAYATKPIPGTPPGWFSHETVFDKDKKI